MKDISHDSILVLGTPHLYTGPVEGCHVYLTDEVISCYTKIFSLSTRKFTLTINPIIVMFRTNR